MVLIKTHENSKRNGDGVIIAGKICVGDAHQDPSESSSWSLCAQGSSSEDEFRRRQTASASVVLAQIRGDHLPRLLERGRGRGRGLGHGRGRGLLAPTELASQCWSWSAFDSRRGVECGYVGDDVPAAGT